MFELKRLPMRERARSERSRGPFEERQGFEERDEGRRERGLRKHGPGAHPFPQSLSAGAPELPPHRPSLLSVLSLILFAVSGCAPTPPPGPGGPPVVGAYTGSLTADGQTFGATLRLEAASPGRSAGTLSISDPVAVEGDVSAVAIRGLLRIDVAYTDAQGCEGRISGILDVENDGGILEGPVTLMDCGEPVAGRLRFRRTGV
ncbi:MAG: hypothetical protein R3304_03500 [Longimicrobiales bacterium]|nr:hypothetical protein [Longimicrobiales bacterium]